MLTVCRSGQYSLPIKNMFGLVEANLMRGDNLSIVIIGGNERMVCQYEDICKNYACKVKVFAKENGALKKKIGLPDLIVVFTKTVSHKMVISAIGEAKRNNIPVARAHSSSATAVCSILEEHILRPMEV